MKPEYEKRFWERVNKNGPQPDPVKYPGLDQCWQWTAFATPDGYGMITVEGKPSYAHRLSYAMHVSAIPKGLHVRHKCDNPGCLNPSHLLVGTPAQNSNDARERGRLSPGNRGPWVKLTEAEVKEIRQLLADGVTQVVIAAKFDLCRNSVSSIATKKTWKHI